MNPDSIERETIIAAPVERVWALLTEAEHIRAWFAFGGVDVDLRPGGALRFRWEEHGEFPRRPWTRSSPRLASPSAGR